VWPHRLARELGYTIAHLDRTMSVGEWLRWIALFKVEAERAQAERDAMK
jgi:uncharacterized small protein (DUF1192 family)